MKGLDRLSFSNVSLSCTNRYWAHLVVALLVVVSVCYILRLELQDYVRVRRSVMASESNTSHRLSLLLLSNSEQQLSIRRIRRHFHNIAGGVHTVTLNRDYTSLRAKLRQRDASIERLEVAETNLIVKANSRRNSNRYSFNSPHHQLTLSYFLDSQRGRAACCLSARGRLFDSGPDHVLARTYCESSLAEELAKDPIPRLVFLYASKRCSSSFDHGLCLLVLERPCSASLESCRRKQAQMKPRCQHPT